MRHLKKSIWPYQFKFDQSISNDIRPLIDFCNRCIGKRGDDWALYVSFNNYHMGFKDEVSVLVFKLAWSNNGN